MANAVCSLFIVSDRTGITLEQLVRALMTQFDDACCERVVLPFCDSADKIDAAVAEINAASREHGHRVVVFSSIVDDALRARLKGVDADVVDLFSTFLPGLSVALGLPTHGHVGRSHGMGDLGAYDRRVDAINFALNHDDGSRLAGLDSADLVLVGVLRTGKTPTCLYLALQYAVRAANFPLTEDDFLAGRLPAPLQGLRGRLFGLTIAAERLHRIREERRPGSAYASLPRCRREIGAAEALFRDQGIPYLDSTTVSIEELAIEIMQRIGVDRGHGF